MNRWGQAAKVAYDPALALRFVGRLDSNDLIRRSEHWDDNITGRTLRRWESQVGITAHGLQNVLGRYVRVGSGTPVTVADFEAWAGTAARTRG